MGFFSILYAHGSECERTPPWLVLPFLSPKGYRDYIIFPLFFKQKQYKIIAKAGLKQAVLSKAKALGRTA
jgi:hypothetical protein